MIGRKKILFQAAAVSAALAFVGVGVNIVNLTASAPYESTLTAERVRITTDSVPRPPEDVRVEERVAEGEYIAEWREEAERSAAAPRERAYEPGSEPPGADGVMGEVDTLAYAEPPLARTGSGLTRSEAMVRVEDIQHELLQDLYPEDRAVLEREKFNLLAEHFPTAAGVEPDEPPAEFGEPKNGDSHLKTPGLDINNIFNKVWGLFQALIVAWATLKFQQNKKAKKDDWLTDSTMDKIDEKLAAKYRTDKIDV